MKVVGDQKEPYAGGTGKVGRVLIAGLRVLREILNFASTVLSW